MKNNSMRKTRMVKSYAPIKNALTELLGIDKPDNTPIRIYCKETRDFLEADEFYVKKYHQDVDPRTLYINSYRNIRKEIWDQKRKNCRLGLGWKSDEQLNAVVSTLDNFLNWDENNA